MASFFLAYYKWSPGFDTLYKTTEIDIEFAGKTNEVEFAVHYTDSSGKHIHPKGFDPRPVVRRGHNDTLEQLNNILFHARTAIK